MTERPAAELPAGSRISSRVDGDEFIITIPGGGRRKASLGFSAATAFLGVTFTAQGLLTHNTGWSAAGLILFLLAVAMLLKNMSGSLRNQQKIKLRTNTEGLMMESGSSDVPARQNWTSAEIVRVGAEGGDLSLYLTGARSPVKLAEGLEPAEAQWVAEQLQLLWRKRDM